MVARVLSAPSRVTTHLYCESECSFTGPDYFDLYVCWSRQSNEDCKWFAVDSELLRGVDQQLPFGACRMLQNPEILD